MSHVAFDQLLQVTAPERPSQEHLPQNDASRDRFQSHLERASNLADPKPSETSEPPTPKEDEPPIESQTDQHEASTTQQEESTPVDESSESTNEATETDLTQDQPQDEVTLSEAAVADGVIPDTQIAINTGQASTATGTPEASTSDDQQPTQQQPTAELTESKKGNTKVEAATGLNAETPVESVDLKEKQATEEINKLTSGTQAKDDSTEQEATKQVRSSTAERKANPTAENLTNPEKQQAEQTTTEAHPLATEVPAAEKNGEATEPTTKKQEPPPIANRPPTTTETEITELHNKAEPNAPTPSSTTSNETPLAAERSLGRLLPGSATSRGTSEIEPTAPVDRARFVQRVGGAIRAAQQRDGQIQLRLSPPELGSLRIEIAVKNGVVTAKLEAETPAARAVLLDNLPALRERLAEQEIRIEKFDVDVRREGQQQSENPSSEERQANPRREESTPAQKNRPTSQLELSAPEIQNSLPTDNRGLDVRI